jgi:hypothetical protein
MVAFVQQHFFNAASALPGRVCMHTVRAMHGEVWSNPRLAGGMVLLHVFVNALQQDWIRARETVCSGWLASVQRFHLFSNAILQQGTPSRY